MLGIKPDQTVVFERFSDSAGGYVLLDPKQPQVFKTLNRAAKAKLKLRLKATVTPVAGAEKKEATVAIPIQATQPTAVCVPVVQSDSRDSTALDGRSVGTGIFEFREARASQHTLVDTSEAPVPQAFSADTKAEMPQPAAHRNLAFRQRVAATVNEGGHPWSVYCNACDAPMADAHFHCSICDGGDYDLCEACVARGVLCRGEDHWLIKRFIKDGKVVNSTTERVSPRKALPIEADIEKDIPGAFTQETKTLAEEPQRATRTCNSCVIVLPEHAFVTCQVCEDFDLCLKCHTSNKHGHHPAHHFTAATPETVLPFTAGRLLAAGRNVRHNAICDGCDNKIVGVRHKCLNCPDWDYCDTCMKTASTKHPLHRFAPIYTPIPDLKIVQHHHQGIYCDGPLCNGKADQTYIRGVRFKCAVCNDTDFCASCEAYPQNKHNRTHPLIKFATPIRNVSITTENEDLRGNVRLMGDRRPVPVQTQTRSASTETIPVQHANAATQVQTMAEIKPIEEKAVAAPLPFSRLIPVPVAPALNAVFVKDTIQDGTVVQPGSRITQIWTMRNPGPTPWPAGCSVRFVGGDNMLDVDNERPASVTDIANASESNVVAREVRAGERVGFKVTLKAPMREGKSISYWRMKSADGTPFGHRLWCDVDVKKSIDTTFTSEVTHAPAALPAFNPTSYPMQQAQLSRMQAIREQHSQMLQHQHMLAQQAQAGNAQFGLPPAYEAATNQVNISARIAAMREQQAKRREHMMAQFNAQHELQQQQSFATAGQAPPVVAGSSTEPGEVEKPRKEAARVRVEHIKAKIMRAREEKAKAELSKKATEAAVVTANEESETKSAEDLEGSQMVFPKLDKESPASSTYESLSSSASKGKAAYVENEAGVVERSAVGSPMPMPEVTSPAIEEDYEDLDGEMEVLSADGEDSGEDDGFMTDEEEWDVLDASDHETVG